MELRLLQYFLAVAREENITRAAESLHLTQPTLSRQLTQLEKDLGTALFNRDQRRITLTAQGVLFRRRAQEIIDLVEKSEQEMTQQEANINGNIAIGCGELFGVQLLAEAIVEFHKLYPEVTFSMNAGDAEQTDMRMEMGLLDLAIFLEPMDLSKYQYVRLGQTEQWCVMLAADDPLAQKKSVEPSDFKNREYFLPYRERAHKEILNWLGKNYQASHEIGRSNLSTNISVLVHKGMGCSFIIQGSKPYLDKTALALRPLSPALNATTVLAWKQHQPFSLASTKFLEFVQEYFAKNKKLQ